jgi:hypothetical protein
MDRTSAPGNQLIAGIRQWVNKNLLAGVPGTQVDQVFMNDLQEELVHAFIESSYVAGATTEQVPTAGVQNQVKAATDFFYGYKVKPMSAGHTIQVYDRGTVFECNAGCNNINVPAATTTGFDQGFIFGVMGNQNTTSINLTSALNDGGALQGVSEFSIGVGDFVIFQAQGVNWGIIAASSGLMTARGTAVFSTAGSFNWTPPNGVWGARVTMIGAGGGGANYAGGAGGGGGAGAMSRFVISCTPGTAIAGSVGTAGGPSGVEGGATTFSGVTCSGGNPGVTGVGGNGGAVTGMLVNGLGAQFNVPGSFGSDLGDGAVGFWGGAGKGGATNGSTATGFGSGGGGARGSGGAAGSGCAGVVLIEWGG